MAQQSEQDVIIVGAGIIGLAVAQKLQEAGRGVTLVDRKGIAREASERNAAGLAFSDIMPLATQGKMSKVPRWLLDPLGPLTIPAGYFPRVFPWLVRFWRAGWPDRVEASIRAQVDLMHLAREEMAAMISACSIGHMLRSDGSLELYESEAAFRAAQPGWRRREEAGIAFEHVRGARLAELQPGLSPRFIAGTFVPSWQTVSDPYDFACAVADHVLGQGGQFVAGEVAEVRPEEKGARVELSDGRALHARDVVVAAGAWSKPLAAGLGDHIPLETERGYNTTLPPSAFDLKRMLIFGDHGFVITPLSTGIRVGGAVELAGLERAPNYARADAMLDKAAKFLPGLKTEGGEQWMGFRPSLPDTLPAIGHSRASRHILYAFGHGHLGLTQSAATGRLVRDLLTGAPPAMDFTPFSPQRF
jgi:D-amino-acid dehydrogenase